MINNSILRLSDADRAMLDGLGDQAPALVGRAVDWCAINSGSRNLEGLARQAALLAPELARLPGELETVALAQTVHIDAEGAARAQANGAALLLTVRPEAGIQAVLTGHYDTVYPVESPFQSTRTRADGALHGPGIADMKGGISVMLGALAAFEAHPDAPKLGYRLLLSPDEETGSLASAPLLMRIGGLGHVGMTYEPALSDGRLAGARKGSGNFHLVVRGRAAHAGRDFASGRNAVAAAATAAVALAALNGRRDGVTLNVSRIDGGSPLNQVPDIAVARFNVRYPDPEAGAWALEAIQAVADAVAGDGISAALHGGVHRPAKPFNAAQQALFGAVKATGALIGQDIAWAPSGGVCEGNNLFAAGLPNVDTLGVRGGDIHSTGEFAWPDSFVERARLSALLLARLASGQIDGPALRAAMDAPPPRQHP